MLIARMPQCCHFWAQLTPLIALLHSFNNSSI
jgi:hypothetical protein